MRIAVIGSGIAGLGAAWLLARAHDVVLFEARSRLGGHTHTHAVAQDGVTHAVDSGFIVYNRANYPLLSRLFDELGVETQPTTMSFAVSNECSGLEYNAGTLGGLLARRRNLVNPRFWRMLADLRRFYREAPALLASDAADPELGEFLRDRGYGAGFIDDHLVPMVSALWSAPAADALRMPARSLVQFMANHRMLRIAGRPEWRVVRGGSSSYVRAMAARWTVEVRLDAAATRVARTDAGVEVQTRHGVERFDQIVMACHSDEALAVLAEPSAAEREILGAIGYQPNEVTLHTDARLLPGSPRARAAWNVRTPRDDPGRCIVSYCMNLLQSIRSREPYVVTLNATDRIDPAKILARMSYAHPVQTARSVAARARRAEINGTDRIWYAGAWAGWGFHEDGLRSAVEVAAAFGVRWG